jgi:signal transduction histidine kinase
MQTSKRWQTRVAQALGKFARTLQFRLLMWNAGVVLLTAAVTLAALREGVRFALLHEVDQLLLEDLHEVELMLNNSPIDYRDLYEALDQRAEGHLQHGWFVSFLGTSEVPVWSSDNTPALNFERRPPLDESVPTTLGDFRVVEHRIRNSRDNIVSVRVGTSLQPMRRELNRIDRQVAIAAGIVLVLAPLLAFWLAGRATQPLAEMIHTASRLRPSHLEERVPIRGTGDELDQLASTINNLLDRIAQHLERKQDLLANAAHELRTPLAAIRSSIEVTLNEPRSTETYEELLGEVIEESATLEALVNQLLLLSEAEAHSEPQCMQLVRLEQAVRRSVEMFDGVAESRGLTLSAELDPCTVSGNYDHLRQVVNNLLDNAIKFTPPGGSIRVSLHPRRELQIAELRVTDTGRGIAPADQERVFERFYRSKPTAGETNGRWGGTGLGLSICEAIVVAHKGQISLTSQPGEGTTVVASLPLANNITDA